MDVNLSALDPLKGDAIDEIARSWCRFRECTESLLVARSCHAEQHPELESLVGVLCRHGLRSLVVDHLLQALEDCFKKNAVSQFWLQFDTYRDHDVLEAHKTYEDWPNYVLGKALEQICRDNVYQEECLTLFVGWLKSHVSCHSARMNQFVIGEEDLFSMHQLRVSSILLMTFPSHFSEILRYYFRKNLEDLSKLMVDEHDEDDNAIQTYDFGNYTDIRQIHARPSKMEVDGHRQRIVVSRNHIRISNIGKVVHDLRSLGFTSVTEDAYASAIFSLLKEKVYTFAGDDHKISALESTKEWIQTVPLQFLRALFSYLGDSSDNDYSPEVKSPLGLQPSCPGISPSEGLVRWQLRLEYFAYETLQDLRIGNLFEIIVDYPDSCPAIDDLRQCLEYTGQHSKLADSFVSSLRYRLLSAGASTSDILHQYVSTIKALRTIDPTGILLEAVGEPIRDYLKSRKDTVKCIVTMLTDARGGDTAGMGNGSDSLLEELNLETENQDRIDYDDDIIADDRQAWLNAESWEPDPVEADPTKGCRGRRKVDILEKLVGIIGSKDQLVNEYRVMLAEKLLSKSDYDIDSEIRTLELLKIHFGESSMQKCEIMLNDLIDSKRTNTNIKASISPTSQTGTEQGGTRSLDILDATIISSNFWPLIQSESTSLPAAMDHLLSDYAKRYHEIKAPRKLSWLKNLGTIKLELQFESRSMQFSVTPAQAAIIMKFQEQERWNLKDLATSMGLTADSVAKKISFWISKGILAESLTTETDGPVYTILEEIDDTDRNAIINENSEQLLSADEEEESSLASTELQLQKEMAVYEKFIIGMLTNFGSMTLDRIHNTLKMFCIAELTYDKSLQQLQSFLSSLLAEEKLEMRDGSYFLKK